MPFKSNLWLIIDIGNITGGVALHPDGNHLIYSLGSTLIVKNVETNEQTFLQGHTNDISCLSVSSSGLYIASGQSTHMGFKVYEFYVLCLNNQLCIISSRA